MQYQIGSADFTLGSQDVYGHGTEWLTNAAAGNSIIRRDSLVDYVIGSVPADDHIVLVDPYAGITENAVAYSIQGDFVGDDDWPLMALGDKEAPTVFNRAMRILAAKFGAAGPVPSWIKIGAALPYTSFQVAALTKSNNIYTLPAGGVIHGTKIKHSTLFVGAAIATLTLKLGIAAIHDKYGAAFDVLTAVSGTNFQINSVMDSESHTAGTNIVLTADSTGANLAALSAGVVDVWALVSIAL